MGNHLYTVSCFSSDKTKVDKYKDKQEHQNHANSLQDSSDSEKVHSSRSHKHKKHKHSSRHRQENGEVDDRRDDKRGRARDHRHHGNGDCEEDVSRRKRGHDRNGDFHPADRDREFDSRAEDIADSSGSSHRKKKKRFVVVLCAVPNHRTVVTRYITR